MIIPQLKKLKVDWQKVFILWLTIFFLILGIFRIEKVPPLWWDEGWTLSVARNWVELGHYGLVRNGEPQSKGLAGHFPVVAPVALSFRLFGVGIWQGRLPGVLFTLGSMVLMYYLAARLYNKSIAVGTIGVLLLMSIGEYVNPLLVGRQVLGEMPVLFYLLIGYTFLLAALRKSPWWIILSMIFWGIAVKTKAQVLPFWLASLMVPFMVSLLKKWWRAAAFLTIGGIGSWVMVGFVGRLQGLILAGRVVPGELIQGIYDVTALVPDFPTRLVSLRNAFFYGLPTLLGLLYVSWQLLQYLRQQTPGSDIEVVRLALFGLAGGWLTWYILLAMHWERYLFPPIFLGSIFTSAFLYEISGHFDFRATVKHASATILKRQLNRKNFGALLVVLLIAMTVPIALLSLFVMFIYLPDSSVVEVAGYLNNHTSPDSLIETYDSEIFVFLNRRYHFPPDQVFVQLNRIKEFGSLEQIDYDPLEADPDYLVIGEFSEMWGLYDSVLGKGEFRLLCSSPNYRYRVYERIRGFETTHTQQTFRSRYHFEKCTP